jgi:hypothetical protein
VLRIGAGSRCSRLGSRLFVQVVRGSCSVERCQERLNLFFVQAAPFLGGVDIINDCIRFVAVPLQKSPGHLLFAAPGHADWPNLRVPGDVNVMPVVRVGFAIRTGDHFPGFARVELWHGGVGQAQAQADSDIHEHGAFHFGLVGGVDFGESFDLVAFFGGDPAGSAPGFQGVEHDQATVGASGFFEVLAFDFRVRDGDQRFLFDPFEAQCLMGASGDHAIAKGVITEHWGGNGCVAHVEVVFGGQADRSAKNCGEFQVAFVAFSGAFTELKVAGFAGPGHGLLLFIVRWRRVGFPVLCCSNSARGLWCIGGLGEVLVYRLRDVNPNVAGRVSRLNRVHAHSPSRMCCACVGKCSDPIRLEQSGQFYLECLLHVEALVAGE